MAPQAQSSEAGLFAFLLGASNEQALIANGEIDQATQALDANPLLVRPEATGLFPLTAGLKELATGTEDGLLSLPAETAVDGESALPETKAPELSPAITTEELQDPGELLPDSVDPDAGATSVSVENGSVLQDVDFLPVVPPTAAPENATPAPVTLAAADPRGGKCRYPSGAHPPCRQRQPAANSGNRATSSGIAGSTIRI